MAKGFGIKFQRPLLAVSVDPEIARTDADEGSSIWVVDVHGISNRFATPAAVDATGNRIDRVENVFEYDQIVAARLRALASSYHAMHDAMQSAWAAEIAKLTPIEKSAALVKVETER